MKEEHHYNDGLYAIQKACYSPRLDWLESTDVQLHYLQRWPSLNYVALVDGVLAGYLIAFPIDRHDPLPKLHTTTYTAPTTVENAAIYMHDVSVHPTYQGIGISRMLCGTMFESGRMQGFSRVWAVAVSEKALKVWTRIGFVLAGHNKSDDTEAYQWKAIEQTKELPPGLDHDVFIVYRLDKIE